MKPRTLYRAWREAADESELTSREIQERDQARARERALPAIVRERAEALVGFEVSLIRRLEAHDGSRHPVGAIFAALSRIEGLIVVKLLPTKEKKKSGKPQVPTTFITLQPEWVESTGRKIDVQEDEEELEGEEAPSVGGDGGDVGDDDGDGWQDRRSFDALA
jgi:hypothetical protein